MSWVKSKLADVFGRITGSAVSAAASQRSRPSPRLWTAAGKSGDLPESGSWDKLFPSTQKKELQQNLEARSSRTVGIFGKLNDILSKSLGLNTKIFDLDKKQFVEKEKQSKAGRKDEEGGGGSRLGGILAAAAAGMLVASHRMRDTAGEEDQSFRHFSGRIAQAMAEQSVERMRMKSEAAREVEDTTAERIEAQTKFEKAAHPLEVAWQNISNKVSTTALGVAGSLANTAGLLLGAGETAWDDEKFRMARGIAGQTDKRWLDPKFKPGELPEDMAPNFKDILDRIEERKTKAIKDAAMPIKQWLDSMQDLLTKEPVPPLDRPQASKGHWGAW